jgi:ABC-type transport system involved in multi-copper enzyme maturation permease subunit
MRLLAVELTRLRWRRAVVILLAGCVVIPALLWAGLAWSTRPVSEAEIQRAKDIVAQNLQGNQEMLDQCIADPGDFGVPSAGGDPKQLCQEYLGVGSGEDYRWYLTRQPLDVAGERQGTGLAVISLVSALTMLLGTTFAGHDWNSGSMSNQLLFEPRRRRVWLAKAAAVFATSLAVSAVVLALWWAAVWLLAGSRDVQASGHDWGLIAASAARGSLLAAGAAVAGYALTMFFRSTVATLGVMFAVAVAGQAVFVAVLGESALRWVLPTNIAAFLFNGYAYYDGSSGNECVDLGNGAVECGGGMAHLSLAFGATYLLVLLGISVALSLWSFQRRDVP